MLAFHKSQRFSAAKLLAQLRSREGQQGIHQHPKEGLHGEDWNLRRTWRAIGPYKFQEQLVHALWKKGPENCKFACLGEDNDLGSLPKIGTKWPKDFR